MNPDRPPVCSPAGGRSHLPLHNPFCTKEFTMATHIWPHRDRGLYFIAYRLFTRKAGVKLDNSGNGWLLTAGLLTFGIGIGWLA